MSSKTKKTEAIRQRKERRRGTKRKAKTATEGSTKSADELFKVQKD